MAKYKPASEINQTRIEQAIKKLGKKTVKPRDIQDEMNRRFDRLTNDNIGMYDELYPKYITAVKKYESSLIF